MYIYMSVYCTYVAYTFAYIYIYIYNMQYTDKSKQRQGNPYVTRMIAR